MEKISRERNERQWIDMGPGWAPGTQQEWLAFTSVDLMCHRARRGLRIRIKSKNTKLTNRFFDHSVSFTCKYQQNHVQAFHPIGSSSSSSLFLFNVHIFPMIQLNKKLLISKNDSNHLNKLLSELFNDNH